MENIGKSNHNNFIISDNLFTTKENYKTIEQKDFKKYLIEQFNNNNKNIYSYEVIKNDTNAKIVIDLDNKKDKNGLRKYKPIDYNFILNYGNDFINFIKNTYHITNDITYYLKTSNEENEINFNINDIAFNSVHLIFNLYTNNFKNFKEVIINFLKKYTQYTPYTDINIYSKNRKMRTIGAKKPNRRDIFYVVENEKIINWVDMDNTRIVKYLITNIDTNDIFLNIHSNDKIILFNDKIILNEDQDQDQNETENIKYNNDNDFTLFKKEIKTLKYMNKDQFYKTLFTLIQIIKQDTKHKKQHQELINDFLNIERSDRYADSYENDKKLLNDFINNNNTKNTDDKYFIPITQKEITFIKSHIHNDTNIIFNVIKLKKSKYVLNVKNTNIFYDTNKKILITEGIIKNKKSKKTIFKLLQSREINYYIENITKRTIYNDNYYYKINEINEWNEIKESDTNEYNWGAVGSKKSYLRMRNDIIYTLKKNENNKIIIVSDTISLSYKTLYDIENILKELYETDNVSDLIYHYSNKKILNDSIKVYITTYDSITKNHFFSATHIFIDEVYNVMKRIYTIQKETRNDKIPQINQLKQLFKNKVVKLYDADYNKEIEGFLQLFFNKNKMRINKLINFIQYNNNLILQREEESKNEIINLLKTNHKITISTSYFKYGEELRMYLLEKTNNKNIIFLGKGTAITSENNLLENETRKGFFKRITENTELWNNYDCIIYTTSITTGISYNKYDTFYKHFSFIGEHGGDNTQNSQFLFRTRHLISKTISIIPIKHAFNLIKEQDNTNNYTIMNKNNDLFIDSINGDNNINYIEENEENEDYDIAEIGNIKIEENDYNYYDNMKENRNILLYVENMINKEKLKNKTKINSIMKNCFNWGMNNFNSNLIEITENDQEEETNNEQEEETTIKIVDTDIWNNTRINKNKYTKEEIDRINDNNYTDKTEYNAINKYLLFKKFNYSIHFINYLYDNKNLFYDTNSEKYVDSHNFINCYLNEDTYKNLYGYQKLYKNYQMNDLIQDIFNNFLKNDYTQDINKTHIYNNEATNKDRTNNTYNLYSSYVVNRLFNLCNITKEDIHNFIENGETIKISKVEYFNIMKGIFNETEKIYNFLVINYTDKNNHKANRSKKDLNEYKKIMNMLKMAFKHYNIEIKTGKEDLKKATKEEKYIIIENIKSIMPTILNTFRIQKYNILYNKNHTQKYNIIDLYDITEKNYTDIRPLITTANYNDSYNLLNNYKKYLTLNTYTDLTNKIKIFKTEIENVAIPFEEEEEETTQDIIKNILYDIISKIEIDYIEPYECKRETIKDFVLASKGLLEEINSY